MEERYPMCEVTHFETEEIELCLEETISIAANNINH